MGLFKLCFYLYKSMFRTMEMLVSTIISMLIWCKNSQKFLWHDRENILVIKALWNQTHVFLFFPVDFIFNICYIVKCHVLFDEVADFLVLIQKLYPVAFSHAHTLAQGFSSIAKDDSHVESAIICSNHGFVLISNDIFPLLVQLVPYLYDTFLDEKDFVNVVQLIKD